MIVYVNWHVNSPYSSKLTNISSDLSKINLSKNYFENWGRVTRTAVALNQSLIISGL